VLLLAWLWSGPGREFPQFPCLWPDERRILPAPGREILQAMVWEIFGWVLDHPILSAIVVAIVVWTVVFALPVARRGNK